MYQNSLQGRTQVWVNPCPDPHTLIDEYNRFLFDNRLPDLLEESIIVISDKSSSSSIRDSVTHSTF